MSSSPSFLSRLKTITERLAKIALYVGMGWVIVMMLLSTFDVTGRYFFSKPVPGAIEMSEFMLGIFGILGMAYTHIKGANVKVTILTQALPPRAEKLLESITSLLSFQIMGMLVWYGIVSGIEEFHAGTTTDTLGISIYPLYFLLSVGAGILCLELLLNFIESIRGLLGIQDMNQDRVSD